MAVQSLAKGVNHSPRKVSVVATLVRGRTVADALVILEHTPRRTSLAVIKAIKSAAANADYNHHYRPDTLRITEITVTPGRRQKRYRPVARGMAHPFQHRSSHIKVVVDGEIRQPKKPAAAAKKTVAPAPVTTDKESK
jgi:large subunit ribosomal protein L22